MKPVSKVTAGIDSAKTALKVDGVHGANADQIAQQARNVGLIIHAERMPPSEGGGNARRLDNLRHNKLQSMRASKNYLLVTLPTGILIR